MLDKLKKLFSKEKIEEKPEPALTAHCTRTLPNWRNLLESGFKKQKLRAHSNYYWNTAVNNWAMTHWSWADIMCESKRKNLASVKLFNDWQSNVEVI